MKKSEVRVGGHYVAKVSGRLTVVRLDTIRETSSYRAHQPHTPTTRFDVTNLKTGRPTTFRSATKFRREIDMTGKSELDNDIAASFGCPVLKGVPKPNPTAPTAKTPASTPTTRPVNRTADTAAAVSPGASGPNTIAASPKREVRDTYFKDYGDGKTFISGLPIPKDADGVCRNVRFINCDFHAGCDVPTDGVEYVDCHGTCGGKGVDLDEDDPPHEDVTGFPANCSRD